MTIYQDVFGGANVYPSDVSYSAVTLTANTTYYWPAETSASANLVTRIMDVVASPGPLSLTMPDAREVGTGETVLFNNTGANSFIVKDAQGVQIVSISAGEAWQIYVTNNSTLGGVWESFQYGASVSQANASALAGTGLVAIGSLLSQSVPVSDFNSNYTAGTNDRAKMFVWTGAAGTLTLPDAVSVGNNWFLLVRNGGTGALTVDPTGSPTIDGSATKSYQPGESSIIATDGANYYTIGFGQSATFAFDYTSINIAGTGTYTLSGSELNRIVYKFTGALTGNREVRVPATVQQYWVDNGTSGAYTLTIKPSAGTGVVIASGERAILYCDGTNVVDADTAGVSLPLTVAQGGTGATTASAARTNLGATTVGDALFIAASANAAWAALGNSPGISGGTY